MSKERELLKEFIDFVDSYEFYPTERSVIWEIVTRANAILAQPEQLSTTRHALDSYWNQEAYQRGYAEAKLKLKRKPLTGKEISNGFKADDDATHPYSYWAGVDFAEKHHGIGGGE